jgi:DNA polymerase-4
VSDRCDRLKKLFGTGEEMAYEIKERIKKELGITVSVGLSFNKVFAKLASDMKKPDAVTVIKKKILNRSSGLCLSKL